MSDIEAKIKACDDAYWHSMRTPADLIDRDEMIERLEAERAYILKREQSRLRAIEDRRREFRNRK